MWVSVMPARSSAAEMCVAALRSVRTHANRHGITLMHHVALAVAEPLP